MGIGRSTAEAMRVSAAAKNAANMHAPAAKKRALPPLLHLQRTLGNRTLGRQLEAAARSGALESLAPLRACRCGEEPLKTSPLPEGAAELEEELEPAHRGGLRSAKVPPLESWVVGRGRPAQCERQETLLESWVVGGAATAGTNTIKCDGKGGIVVQAEGTGDAAHTACLGDCIRQHEQSHRSDALAANAKICDGAAAGNIVTVDTAAERKATEVKASNVEIACLKAKPKTKACKDIIARRITQMKAYRDSF